MKKEKQLKYIRENISKFLSSEQVEKVIKICDDILDDDYSPDLIQRLVYYADKQFQHKYGSDEMFTDYPISAKVRVDFKKFILKNKLDEDYVRKYITWIVGFDNSIMQRRVNIFDLYNDKLWNKFKVDYRENMEDVVEKNKTSKKRVLFKL
jgi:hypothetical protein